MRKAIMGSNGLFRPLEQLGLRKKSPFSPLIDEYTLLYLKGSHKLKGLREAILRIYTACSCLNEHISLLIGTMFHVSSLWIAGGGVFLPRHAASRDSVPPDRHPQ